MVRTVAAWPQPSQAQHRVAERRRGQAGLNPCDPRGRQWPSRLSPACRRGDAGESPGRAAGGFTRRRRVRELFCQESRHDPFCPLPAEAVFERTGLLETRRHGRQWPSQLFPA
jgi:hypothetical protein